jgi:hypothetical protein
MVVEPSTCWFCSEVRSSQEKKLACLLSHWQDKTPNVLGAFPLAGFGVIIIGRF